MVIIYLIEDINGLKYVGSTCKTLKWRLANHRYNKKHAKYSSHQLDLDNCEISVIEECSDDIRMEREAYHIQHTDCVNQMRYDFDSKAYMREYTKRPEHLEKMRKYCMERRKEHREEINEKIRVFQSRPEQRAKQKAKRDYQKTWGGSPSSNNNLLLISVDLFQ